MKTYHDTSNDVQDLCGTATEPEIREIAPGRTVARLTLKTCTRYIDKEGRTAYDRTAHTVVAWGRNAEMLGRLVREGSPLCITGRTVERPGVDTITHKRRTVREIVLVDFSLAPTCKK